MQTSPGIHGKVVAITGASSGIGQATALLLAERGVKVVLGERGPDRLKALAARIAEAGAEASKVSVERSHWHWQNEGHKRLRPTSRLRTRLSIGLAGRKRHWNLM